MIINKIQEKLMLISPELGFPEFLHKARSAALAGLETPNVLLSAGCSGRWYFDWIEHHLGVANKHIGVEFYSPKPAELPNNVRWLQENIYQMKEVDDQSVDMVFSGQNCEHLWPKELAGFLLESFRIIKDGGTLVIDSPNFPICQKYGWSHPEHTVELSVPQIIWFLQLAGFSIEHCLGLWNCVKEKEYQPLFTGDRNKPISLEDCRTRLSSGISNPESSFLWWIVARKTPQPVTNHEALINAIKTVFDFNWPLRIQRMTVPENLVSTDDGTYIYMDQGESGVGIFGPYIPLNKGTYSAGFFLSAENTKKIKPSDPVGYLDCAIGVNGDVIQKREISYRELSKNIPNLINTEITLEQLTFGVQFRFITYGNVKLKLNKKLILTKLF